MRIVLTVVGIVVALLGLLWMGQGSGLFPYPPQSFMVNDHNWIWRGGGVVLVGVILIVVGRRRR